MHFPCGVGDQRSEDIAGTVQARIGGTRGVPEPFLVESVLEMPDVKQQPDSDPSRSLADTGNALIEWLASRVQVKQVCRAREVIRVFGPPHQRAGETNGARKLPAVEPLCQDVDGFGGRIEGGLGGALLLLCRGGVRR